MKTYFYYVEGTKEWVYKDASICSPPIINKASQSGIYESNLEDESEIFKEFCEHIMKDHGFINITVKAYNKL